MSTSAPVAAIQQDRSTGDQPRVAVMMPVRQEGPELQDVLDAVLRQDYVRLDRVVVAVGPSTDGTRELVERARRRDARVLVVENTEGIVSTGLNRALELLDEPWVVRIDGHCLVPPDYVRRLVDAVRASGASCAGPRLRTVGRTRRQRAIAAAMSSVYGVGGSRFRTGGRSGLVDTVAFGLYSRDTLVELGGFRPELVRNQDDELNARLRRAGGTIYLDTDLCVDYVPRSTFRELWRQYFEYGYWRTVTARSFGDPLRPRQAAPGLLVLGLAGGTALAGAGRTVPLKAGLAAWSGVLGLLALQTLRRTGSPGVAALSAPAGALLHLSYGCGLWRSALRRSDVGWSRR